MSMIGGRGPQGAGEVGPTVASFSTYEAAQKAVSELISGEIPAREIAIVGKGLRSIERVTGRLGYASAARSGAINGLLLGLLFSAVVVLGTPTVQVQVFVGVLFVGIAIGMLFSIITYSLVRRRRDYASVMAVVADTYEVTVTANSLHRARQVLGPRANGPAPADPAVPSAPAHPSEPPARPAPREEPVHPEAPPQYGERIDPDARRPDGEDPPAS
ncbi:general stress protein [Microbacterium aquimaris]|uniref:general stress protein n=1 Tax=Microbacterium aquimaris TaxID=459816 RepID=UPI002AD3ADDC|nr:general stress protein [Microbacterium aquimaris]MDZ8275611.1 general stress protein [Microbacterium aquimaris]